MKAMFYIGFGLFLLGFTTDIMIMKGIGSAVVIGQGIGEIVTMVWGEP